MPSPVFGNMSSFTPATSVQSSKKQRPKTAGAAGRSTHSALSQRQHDSTTEHLNSYTYNSTHDMRGLFLIEF